MHANDTQPYRTRRTSARSPSTAVVVAEALEGRCHLSAATVWASLLPRPVAPPHAGHGIHVALGRGGRVAVGAANNAKATAGTGPDILGAWVGTFTSNSTQLKASGGFDLTARRKDNFTGTFDTASIGGAPATVTTIVVTKNRQFLVVLQIGKAQRVSFAGIISAGHGGIGGSLINGRYAALSAKGFSTGVFRFERAK